MLVSPNGKTYIGQTVHHIEKRFKQHRKISSGCVAIYNAIQKYGWENFEKDWYECPDEDLNFDEELLVREMGTLAPNGYNLREGGGSSGKMSANSKQKMSEAKYGEKNHNYGKHKSEYTKQKLREANIGKTLSEETKQKLREFLSGGRHPNYGKSLSEETKQKISNANIGNIHTEESKIKISEARQGKCKGDNNHNSKTIYQYDLNGNLLQTFTSSGEAIQILNKKNGANIRKCANGERKSAYNFKWSYVLH